MTRPYLILLVATLSVLCYVRRSARSEDWDLRRDFLPDRFPGQWKYQGAQPKTGDIVDLIPSAGILAEDGTPIKNAWVEPGAVRGTKYGRAFFIWAQPPGQTIPVDSVFVHPETEMDPIVSWTAPLDGTISVKGRSALINCGGTDGVSWSILVDGKEEWSAVLLAPKVSTFDLTVAIHSGETVLFRENTRGTSACDWGYLSAHITYLNADERFKRGDVNGDGVLNIVDPIRTLQYLFADDSIDCLDAADTDDDGTVNISDPIGLLGYLFLGTLPPTIPFNSCGLDAGVDELSCKSFPICQ